VVLKLGHGVFAAYAHMVPGSVRVHRGERVREGQVLGKLGNSGASTGPHLHFQLMNHRSLLDADGLPFVLDGFGLDGRVPSLQALIDADASPPPVPPVPINHSARGAFHHRGLSDLDVVTFPHG
jgi:murein DD-endopeptidase MepM/ murein hydrolase activator NlpD